MSFSNKIDDFYWWQKEARWLYENFDVTILHWPRQSGKTTFGTHILKDHASENRNQNCFGIFLGAFLATFDSKVIKNLLPESLIEERGKNYIRLQNGSEIHLLSSNSDKFKSHNIDFLYLDEYLFFRKKFFEEIIPSLRPNAKIVASCTFLPGSQIQNLNNYFLSKVKFISRVVDSDMKLIL